MFEWSAHGWNLKPWGWLSSPRGPVQAVTSPGALRHLEVGQRQSGRQRLDGAASEIGRSLGGNESQMQKRKTFREEVANCVTYG